MSPDRTIAALRREIYLRKPEVFKMACLRDIKNLFGPGKTPFYAGFGNRLTDALSYRSVSIPSNRIFTINSYAEVSLDLLSLNKLKLSYVNMREVVDHYFPPVSLLVKGGGEEFTDFTYWRDPPLDLDEFSGSEDEDEENRDDASEADDVAEDEDENGDVLSDADDIAEDEDMGEMGDSYLSRDSIDGHGEDSILSGSVLDDMEGNALTNSIDDDGEQRLSSEMQVQEDYGTQVTPILKVETIPLIRTGSADLDPESITGTKTITPGAEDPQPEEM